MKTTISLIAILVFSAILIVPEMPKAYPPKDVIIQRAEINFKEIKLNRLINNLEYSIKKDSLELSEYYGK